MRVGKLENVLMLLHKSDNPFIVCFRISSNYSLNLFTPLLLFSIISLFEFEIILLSILRNVLHVLCRLLSLPPHLLISHR